MKININKTLTFLILLTKNKHNGIALERFFPSGPLAILPMRKNIRSDPNRSSVVWTVDNNLGILLKLIRENF